MLEGVGAMIFLEVAQVLPSLEVVTIVELFTYSTLGGLEHVVVELGVVELQGGAAHAWPFAVCCTVLHL